MPDRSIMYTNSFFENRVFRRLPKIIIFVFFILKISICFSDIEEKYLIEEKPNRLALVIGNSNYENLESINSSALDAIKMREILTNLGFDIINQENTVDSAQDWEDIVLPNFRKKIKPGDLVVIYYSGHGFAYGPDTFLAPLKIPKIIKEKKVTDFAIAVSSIEEYILKREPGLLLIILDSCRSIGNFIINDEKDRPIGILKGPKDPIKPSINGNDIVVFASRQAYPALGSNQVDALSFLTSAITKHLSDKDTEFSIIFNKIGIEVKTATNFQQQPGMFDWSDSDLFLNPTDTITTSEMELWKAALSTNSKQEVENFLGLHSVGSYAASARKWLDDHEEIPEQSSLTLVSPAAIERAWSPDSESRVAIRRLSSPFALERTADLSNLALSAASDSELGIVSSGTTANFIETNSSLISANVMTENDFALNAAQIHETVVLSTPVSTKIVNSASDVTQAEILPVGSTIKVLNIATTSRGLGKLEGVSSSNENILLTKRKSTPLEPLEIGKPLTELFVSNKEGGLVDFLDEPQIENAINILRNNSQTITWVSIASGRNPKLSKVLDARRTHARYILFKNGIDSKRITAVSNSIEIPDNKIRIRFFGY